MARKSRKTVSAPAALKEEKVWKAALYIRLSVELNSRRGDSLETQRQIMEAYVALCPDIEIVEVYTDNAADISRKVRSQQHQAMLEGAFIGGRAPYGYQKDPDNCHKLVVNEDTAPAVRRIFQLIADGVSLNAVVKLLNESDIPTPGQYSASAGIITNRRLIGSGAWHGRNVMRILRDEVYTGDMVQGKTRTVGHKQIPTDPREWIVVRGTHPPLISHELFHQVQAVLAKAAAKAKAADRVPYTKNILRGRIFCGCCGRNLHRQRDHNRRYFYHCISNERIRKGVCSAKGYVWETDLFNTILTLIRQEAETVIGNSLLLKQRDARFAVQKAETEQEIARLCRETERNRAYQASLYQNYASGVLTQTEYAELKEGYRQKIQRAIERVQQLREQQRSLERRLNEYYTLAERLAAMDGDTTLTASLVEQTIERVTVKGPADVTVCFHFTDTFAELMEALDDE